MKKYLLLFIVLTLSTNQVFAADFFSDAYRKILKQLTINNDYDSAEKSYSIFNPQTEPTTPISEIIRTFNTPLTQSTPVRATSQNIQKETALQRLLSGLGVSKSEVKQFQRDNNLKVDGIIGPKTSAKISDIKNESQNGTSKQEFQDGLAKSEPEPKSFQDLLNESNQKQNNNEPPAGSTLGNKASLFAYEQNGEKEKEGTEGGVIMSCGQKMVPGKCFAAISEKKRIEICGSKKSTCYCGMMATVVFPNNVSIQAPIYDTGIMVNGGDMIDLSGECFNNGGIKNGRDALVRNQTTWFVSPGQEKGVYVKNGIIKDATQVAELK